VNELILNHIITIVVVVSHLNKFAIQIK